MRRSCVALISNTKKQATKEPLLEAKGGLGIGA